jgi:hypothetical protein
VTLALKSDAPIQMTLMARPTGLSGDRPFRGRGRLPRRANRSSHPCWRSYRVRFSGSSLPQLVRVLGQRATRALYKVAPDSKNRKSNVGGSRLSVELASRHAEQYELSSPRPPQCCALWATARLLTFSLEILRSPLLRGPRVRIRLPPAVSLVRTFRGRIPSITVRLR